MKKHFILIIEDDNDDAELLLKALKRKRIRNQVIHIRKGEEAIDFLFCRGKFADRPAGHQPVFIFLDLKMPEMDGQEVLKIIKSHPSTREIPVAVFSSSVVPADLDQSYSHGAYFYLQKPIRNDDFDEIINKLGLYWMVINKSDEL